MPGKHRRIRVVCPECERERIIYKRGPMYEGMDKRCNRCSNAKRKGNLHGNWKGGRYLRSNGYVDVLLRPGEANKLLGRTSGKEPHRFQVLVTPARRPSENRA